MKKQILIYGLIMGVVASLNMVLAVSMVYGKNPNFKTSEVLGYASMIIVFAFIFVAIRSYRNNQNGGYISFGNAFKMGALIAFIASTLYVVTWLIVYYNFVPDFMEKYVDFVMDNARAKGASATELAEQSEKMQGFSEMYKNPLMVVLFTYTEILPVGLVVALICSLILKKKPKTPEAALA